MKKLSCFLAICVMFVFWSNNVFAIESDENSIGIIEMQKIEAASSVSSGPFELNVVVDQTYCATGGIQCTGTGHTVAEA